MPSIESLQASPADAEEAVSMDARTNSFPKNRTQIASKYAGYESVGSKYMSRRDVGIESLIEALRIEDLSCTFTPE
jgi:hypothetical protein